jgi:beta-lactamase class D
MTTRTLAIFLAGTGALISSLVLAEPARETLALQDYAGGADTCIALLHRNSGEHQVYGMAQCLERLSPCSTFKIPHALIGLETGVSSGPGDTRKWDGTVHSRTVQNRDHDLDSAIDDSIVWYFQEMAREIGPERMQQALDAFDYGNRDISGGQDRFWLSSSLQISALEQIEFMDRLDRAALPATPDNQATVRGMMTQEKSLPEGFSGDLYAKTGSCIGAETDHGWFTGIYRRGPDSWVFAVNVKGKEQWGWQAREIAVEVLNDLP